MKNDISVILLSTLQCNADCEYCFENKTTDRLSFDQLGEMIRKVLDYMVEKSLATLTLYWQGGEAMLLPPTWYEQANEMIRGEAEARGKKVFHSLQSNMLAYSSRWNKVIAEMFGNSVGTSLDYPNLHRKLLGQGPESYNEIWSRRVREARAAGIEVQVIAVPNKATLEIGAERFYNHFVDELGITDFQVNTPFPGGEGTEAKRNLPVAEVEALSRFYTELADIWLERGYNQGVRVGPLDALLHTSATNRRRCPAFGATIVPTLWFRSTHAVTWRNVTAGLPAIPTIITVTSSSATASANCCGPARHARSSTSVPSSLPSAIA